MKGSVIRRMYAGFILLIAMFALTVFIMMQGMGQIQSNFKTVTSDSLPLVEFANKTSVALLSSDKEFKNFLTTQSNERMNAAKEAFGKSEALFEEALKKLTLQSQSNPELTAKIEQLKSLQVGYFEEAQLAMTNYQAMFSSQEQVQQSYRRFQRLQSELQAGMKKYVQDQRNMAVKLMSKGYFNKLAQAEKTTSDALSSSDAAFVAAAMEKNSKAVEHLNQAYRGLTTRLPKLKAEFDESVMTFTQDIGESGGVLDQYNAYLQSKQALYTNIENLARDIDVAMTILESFNKVATDNLNASLAKSEEVYKADLMKAIIIGIAVSLAAAAIGYHIAHSVREPLTRILSALEALSNNDMTQRIEIRYNNEFSRVARHINTLADSLQDILIKLNGSSDNLTQTAKLNQSISSSAQSQLNTQREQTANVATAMTQMSHSVQEVAQSAQNSLERVHQVEQASEIGRKTMGDNITTIHKLEQRLSESVNEVSELKQMSSQIGSILDVIQNIAEQTNLLALNAAIEAARAGEQGRGFAVVADEVRVLAKRTTDSTSEIEKMIAELQSRSTSANQAISSCMNDMETSVEQASNANSSMEEIQALINEISQMSSYISQAAGEQNETTSDIARSIEEINLIADSSHKAMTEIAQTSNDLTGLASEQSNLVHRFKL